MPKRRARPAAKSDVDGRATGRTVTATEAAKNFGAIVDRVREDRVVYTVERSGKPVAQIGPVASRRFSVRDFVELLESAPKADEEFRQAVEDGIKLFNRPTVPKSRWEP